MPTLPFGRRTCWWVSPPGEMTLSAHQVLRRAIFAKCIVQTVQLLLPTLTQIETLDGTAVVAHAEPTRLRGVKP